MDEFEQKSREIARAILERHGWKRPMSAEVKEMREIADEPLMECKRYLVEEWQNMRIPLLEKENAKLRELVRKVDHYERLGCYDCPHCGSCDVGTLYDEDCAMSREIEREMRELGIEVDA